MGVKLVKISIVKAALLPKFRARKALNPQTLAKLVQASTFPSLTRIEANLAIIQN